MLAVIPALCAHSMAMAAIPDAATAQKVHRLEIMLMVTALRCRHSQYGFQDAYDRFEQAHTGELKAASERLRADYNARYGSKAGKYALDRMSVSMANQYGQGHPSLSCAELGEATRALANDRKPGGLAEAADKLLAENVGPKGFVARY